MTLTPYQIGVVLAAAVALMALTFMVIRTFSFGRRRHYAVSSGKQSKGVIYAFGRGMLPWEKESASGHLFTYFGGFVYHAAIFGAFSYLIVLLTGLKIGPILLRILQILLISGFFCGTGLLLKRTLSSKLMAISSPDDFFANLLADLFLIMTFWVSFNQQMEKYFYLIAILLLLYIPVGKIRHCVYFFYARFMMGRFFGRRGVFPPRMQES
ncbi:conserved membrane hypothetical protein [Candidatus Zixiibacteriota bacterium]|nr:conserved membrane hypothetical protein [candidate division Zixibacteria bacterium]